MTDYTSGIVTAGHPSATGKPVPYRVEFTTTEDLTVGSHEVIKLPAGTAVLDAFVEVTTAGTGSGTVALGDGADVDRYTVAATVTATGYMTATGTKHRYSASDTIDITVAVDTVNARLRVVAVVCDVA